MERGQGLFGANAARGYDPPQLRRMLIGLLLFVGMSFEIAFAGGGPQNVAVIVNPKAPDSLEVANEYVRLRQIPSCNVIYVAWPANARMISSANFRESLIEPVLRELNRRGLAPQIDCIAYSSGFPPTVDL